MLEEQERKWDDKEPLTVIIKTYFDKPIKRVSTGAAIPDHMEKHVYFENSKTWKCYVFLNQKPEYEFEQAGMLCKPEKHKLK